VTTRTRRFLLFYVGWIALCAVLFVALRGSEDPSRAPGRILSVEAGDRALKELRAMNGNYQDYEVVHVAAARPGEGGDEPRWVVLVDRVPHTSLRAARVVELAARNGRLLAIRTPAR
jgi:hypothetical protein